jgi:hypothetical protein
MRWCAVRRKTRCSKRRRMSREIMRGLLTIAAIAAIAAVCGVAGCKSAPAPSTASTAAPATTVQYPARPGVAAPAFKVFHHDVSSITLVTKENATDAEIESLIWELHDAAHTHSFDKLKIEQKLVDARDPMMWFHIYRGAKCASEKYAGGAPPCGASYHAAGDYTLGGFTNRDRDDGELLQGDGRQAQLWDPATPGTNTTEESKKLGATQ